MVSIHSLTCAIQNYYCIPKLVEYIKLFHNYIIDKK